MFCHNLEKPALWVCPRNFCVLALAVLLSFLKVVSVCDLSGAPGKRFLAIKSPMLWPLSEAWEESLTGMWHAVLSVTCDSDRDVTGDWLHINDVFTVLTWCTWDNSPAKPATHNWSLRTFMAGALTCAMYRINQSQIYKWIECATQFISLKITKYNLTCQLKFGITLDTFHEIRLLTLFGSRQKSSLKKVQGRLRNTPDLK